jgi:predicted kinase
MSRLYFMVGLPRSGKSTLAAKWLTENLRLIHDQNGQVIGTTNPPRVVLNGDDFRHAVYGRDFCPEGEGLVFASIDVAARALLRAGYDVLIDETGTTESTIKRYLKIDPDAEAIWVDTPEEECVRRATITNKPYLIPPIKRMAEQMKLLRLYWPKNFEAWREYALMRQKHDTDTKDL